MFGRMFKEWVLNLRFVKQFARDAFNNGYEQRRAEYTRTREIEREIRAEHFFHVGGDVITVSNEWDSTNLIHGQIVGFDERNPDIPLVKDYKTGETYFCMGITVPYHPELLAAFKKLNPFERYSILNSRTAHSAECYIFDKYKREPDADVS